MKRWRCLVRFVVTLLSCVATARATSGESPIVRQYLTVRDAVDVYKAQHQPFLGGNHFDGILAVDFEGIVVADSDGNEQPLAGVQFRVEMNERSMAWGISRRIIFLSNADGEFRARIYVGASFMDDAGKSVYQTDRQTLVISKAGYRDKRLLIDYKMPAVKLFMKELID